MGKFVTSLYNTDYLEHLGGKYGLRPSRKYGQNFLIDESVVEKIIAAGEVKKTDTIVEVGPGFGVLTLALAESAGKVISFEIEKKLQLYWEKKLPAVPNVTIIWGNVLHQFSTVIANEVKQSLPNQLVNGEDRHVPSGLAMTGGYKVIANLPYQITSAVIRLLLEANPAPEVMILMVQKEVAERICAAPGDLSLLALSVQLYATAELLFTVPRTAFWPPPAVDSAVIKITRKPVADIQSELVEPLFKLAKAGFSSKRKLLSKNLLPAVGKKNKAALAEAFEELGLLPTVRAQELSLEEWVALAQRFGAGLKD